MQLYSTNKTAVLIFANSPGVDVARKGIPKSNQLFQSLNNEIIRKVEKTGLPYFLYSEELQTGSDFGTRFTAAIQSIFSKGFDSVIAVGNDTPNLSVANITRSYEKLILGKTVLGPSEDGGVYLLGIHKNRFESVSFQQLPWQKRFLFQELTRYFVREGALHQLPRLIDIDTINDIQAVIDHRKSVSYGLLLLLLSIKRKRSLHRAYRSNVTFSDPIYNPFNKGSPSFLF